MKRGNTVDRKQAIKNIIEGGGEKSMAETGTTGITTDVHTTYRVEGHQGFRFLVTLHTGYRPDMLCIHGSQLGMTLYFNVEQAEDLVNKLNTGLRQIKEYHFKEDITNGGGR